MNRWMGGSRGLDEWMVDEKWTKVLTGQVLF